MDEDLKESLTATDTWIRGLFMLLFGIFYSVAEFVMIVVVIFQFVIMLVKGQTNERLLEFGDDLSAYIFQILQFQTFNTEEKPWPFAPWPYSEEPIIEIEQLPDVPDAPETPEASDVPPKPPV